MRVSSWRFGLAGPKTRPRPGSDWASGWSWEQSTWKRWGRIWDRRQRSGRRGGVRRRGQRRHGRPVPFSSRARCGAAPAAAADVCRRHHLRRSRRRRRGSRGASAARAGSSATWRHLWGPGTATSAAGSGAIPRSSVLLPRLSCYCCPFLSTKVLVSPCLVPAPFLVLSLAPSSPSPSPFPSPFLFPAFCFAHALVPFPSPFPVPVPVQHRCFRRIRDRGRVLGRRRPTRWAGARMVVGAG